MILTYNTYIKQWRGKELATDFEIRQARTVKTEGSD